MRCDEVKYLVSEYVDGAASAQIQQSIDDHLNRCPTCRDEAAEERRVRALLRGDRVSTWNPPDLRLLVDRGITADLRRGRRVRGLWAAAVCASLAFGGSVFSLKVSPLAQQSQPPAVATRVATPQRAHRETCSSCHNTVIQVRRAPGLVADTGYGVIADNEENGVFSGLKGGEQRQRRSYANSGLPAS